MRPETHIRWVNGDGDVLGGAERSEIRVNRAELKHSSTNIFHEEGRADFPETRGNACSGRNPCPPATFTLFHILLLL